MSEEAKTRKGGANLILVSIPKLQELVGEGGGVLVSKKWLQEVAVKKVLNSLEEDAKSLGDANAQFNEPSDEDEKDDVPAVSAHEIDFNKVDED